MKEIVIVGGGLAGLSLGIALLHRGVPVVLKEAGSYPRHRVCGEFMNGVTIQTLKNLQIAHLFDDAMEHSSAHWWVGDRCVLKAKLPRPAIGMSRWEMDEKLRKEFQLRGGQLMVKSRESCRPREGLVWAAGRDLKRESRLLGVKAHFEGVNINGSLEMHLGRGCYIGLTPVTKDLSRVNVCGLFTQYSHSKGENPLIRAVREGGLTQLAQRLEGGEIDRLSLVGVRGVGLGAQKIKDDLCVIGDSERIIPPFTGNGMSMAFEAAESALAPLYRYAQGHESWDQTRKEISHRLDQRFLPRMSLAMKLHQLLINPYGLKVFSVAAASGVLPFNWLHRRLS